MRESGGPFTAVVRSSVNQSSWLGAVKLVQRATSVGCPRTASILVCTRTSTPAERAADHERAKMYFCTQYAYLDRRKSCRQYE